VSVPLLVVSGFGWGGGLGWGGVRLSREALLPQPQALGLGWQVMRNNGVSQL